MQEKVRKGARSVLQEATAATVFLTRLPLPLPGVLAPDLPARAMVWYPLVGVGLGAGTGGVYWLATLLAQPPAVAAVLALAAGVGLTGALHEDGLADLADGFGGGRDRAAKLEIMRDSRIGSFGALALMLSLGLRATAVATLADPARVLAALVAAAALSRAAMVELSAWLAPARRDGLAAGHGRPDPLRRRIAVAAALVIALLALGPVGSAAAAAAVAAAAAGLGRLAWRQIGGYTGDVLGAVQQTGEIAALILLVGLR
ncbi:MAG: adenosylcobinamide-GDP ribazoletransferase [Azospirillum sp.]|nr:adenosylcobinamide-GDP ribazoletransferase [Azospirillum sp.]